MSIKNVYDDNEMEKILLRPYHYVLPIKAYDLINRTIVPSLNFWLKIPKTKMEKVQELIVLFNHSGAMLDDVQDDASFRRYLPAAHSVFGSAFTINCCFHVFLLVLEKTLELDHPEVAKIYCEGMLGYIRGTGTDLYWRDNQTDISHEHYKQMARRKTGDILVMIFKLMRLFSDNKTDYGYFMTLFSMYYQIRDDYCNLKKLEALESPERVKELQNLTTIDFCEDLSDGKISFPIIHSLKSPSRDVILGLLKMRTNDVRVKKYLLSLLEQTGGLKYTRDVLREIEAELNAEIKRLGGNPIMQDFLQGFKNWEEK